LFLRGAIFIEKSNEQTSSKEVIKKEGVIVEAFPSLMFKVKLADGEEVLAHLSGKMRIHKIKILTGDKVTVEFSPYDLKKGRIVYRSK
jgi:translation initiation factor IF-1